jgi:hypothetical protein
MMATAPDSAAGRKAKCRHCGGIIDIPAGQAAAAELAAAVSQLSAAKAGGTAAEAAAASTATATATPPPAPAAETSPLPAERSSSIRNGSSTRSSGTVIDRMVARTSPYGGLRLLSAIIYGVGIALAVLSFLGGVTGLVILSMSGSPWWVGAGAFVGAFILAAIIFIVAKAASELLRLWADVGDRMRHVTQMLEESLNRQRDETL